MASTGLPDVKKAKFIVKPSKDVYDMTKALKGECLIINIEEYKNEKRRRDGSAKDVERFEHVFKHLGFHPVIENNLTGKKMKETLERFCGKSHDQYNAAVVIIMGHGNLEEVEATDGERLMYSEIVEILNNKHCESLRRKPKIFIFQTCHGHTPDQGVRCVDDGIGPPENKTKVIPTQSELFICFAAQSDYLTLRDSKCGGVYAETLAQVLAAEAHDKHLIEMLHLVEQKLTENLHKFKEMNVILSSEVKLIGCTKKLYFNPVAEGEMEKVHRVDLPSLTDSVQKQLKNN